MDDTRAEALLRLTLVTQKIARCLANDAGLGVNEFHCLIQLHLQKSCCVGSLTKALGIRPTSTSKLLRSLDRKGWIIRNLDPVDRRMEVVALTPKGTEAIQRIMQAADGAAVAMVELLPPDRRGPFIECVHTVTRHLAIVSNQT